MNKQLIKPLEEQLDDIKEHIENDYIFKSLYERLEDAIEEENVYETKRILKLLNQRRKFLNEAVMKYNNNLLFNFENDRERNDVLLNQLIAEHFELELVSNSETDHEKKEELYSLSLNKWREIRKRQSELRDEEQTKHYRKGYR